MKIDAYKGIIRDIDHPRKIWVSIFKDEEEYVLYIHRKYFDKYNIEVSVDRSFNFHIEKDELTGKETVVLSQQPLKKLTIQDKIKIDETINDLFKGTLDEK